MAFDLLGYVREHYDKAGFLIDADLLLASELNQRFDWPKVVIETTSSRKPFSAEY